MDSLITCIARIHLKFYEIFMLARNSLVGSFFSFMIFETFLFITDIISFATTILNDDLITAIVNQYDKNEIIQLKKYFESRLLKHCFYVPFGINLEYGILLP